MKEQKKLYKIIPYEEAKPGDFYCAELDIKTGKNKFAFREVPSNPWTHMTSMPDVGRDVFYAIWRSSCWEYGHTRYDGINLSQLENPKFVMWMYSNEPPLVKEEKDEVLEEKCLAKFNKYNFAEQDRNKFWELYRQAWFDIRDSLKLDPQAALKIKEAKHE